MARGIDFLLLYREFQLEPGADIDELKRAYRRRVSLVHPDRLDSKDAISQQLATEHLQRLTTLYEAGVQFHRQHGRLPGASSVAEVQADPIPDSTDTRPTHHHRAKAHRLRWAFVAVLLAGVLTWSLWSEDSSESLVSNQTDRTVHRPALGTKSTTVLPGQDGVRIGMNTEVVVRIIGAPVMKEGERWLYGPSWILFEKGKVVEWYSSPLRPLRISSTPEK